MLRGALAVAVVGLVALVSISWTGRAPAPQTIVVKMVDVSPTEYKFEPANITVNPGDTVRFEQTGVMPHNVEFRDMPAGSNLGAAKMGPFLSATGETYDVIIDGRFTAGKHNYVCTPHEALGMTGSITVSGS